MLKSEKAPDFMMVAMGIVPIFCFLGAMIVVCESYLYTGVGFQENVRHGWLIAYALASVGVALWIGLWRWLKVEPGE